MSIRTDIKTVLFFIIFALAVVPSSRSDVTITEVEIGADSAGDTVFTELHLSEDGVYGIDSSGNEWDYDFSRETFIITSDPDSGTKTVFRVKKGDQRDTGTSPRSTDDQTISTYDGLQMGSVEVEDNEIVNSSITAVGPITVRGEVTGDVTSYSKVTITSTGMVMGNARAPQIVKMRGGIIKGNRIETDMPSIPDFEFFKQTSYTQLIVSAIIFASLLLCGFLAVAVAPKPVNKIRDCLYFSPVKSFFAGLLGWILLGPITGLLCLTIIGIPVAMIILPLAILLAVILGTIGISQRVGEKLGKYFSFSGKSQMGNVFIGIIILSAFWILAGFFAAPISPFGSGMETFILVTAIVVWSIFITFGFGAVMMTRFGSRDCAKSMVDMYKQQEQASMAPPRPTPPPLKPEDENPLPPAPPPLNPNDDRN